MTDLNVEEVKQRVAEEIKRLHPRLTSMSHTLHENPEILFQEHKAAALLTNELDEQGFDVQRGVAGLETAFVATYGNGDPVVGFLAEYDALPKIGHACGHNLIATWSVGAAIALRRALPDFKGTIKVIGTPGEEGGGGKVILANANVFDGLDAAIMMHPRDRTYLNRGSLARTVYDIEFFGKSAHASSAPERGINALDAMLQVFFSINAFRQQMPPNTRIHGVISHGGEAPNVIPDYTAARFLVRAKEQEHLEQLRQTFRAIVEAAALATGCRTEIHEGLSYQARICNTALIETFSENLAALGITPDEPPEQGGVGSSDIGNVSRIVPTMHPYLQICEPGVGGHTTEFAEAAASQRADDLTATGATLLAWTGVDVLLRPEVRSRLRESFKEQMGYEAHSSGV